MQASILADLGAYLLPTTAVPPHTTAMLMTGCYDVPAAAGPHVWPDPSDYVDQEIVFRQLLCPGCFTAVYSRVAPRSHPLPEEFYGQLP